MGSGNLAGMPVDACVWVQGQLVEPDEPVVGALDHGVVAGDGVFEATKVVDGVAFALTRHDRRMDRSIEGLGLPAVDHGLLREGIAAVLGAAPSITVGKLRYWVTAGPSGLGSARTGEPDLRYFAAVEPLPPGEPSGPIHLVHWTRNERSATAGLKTTSYAENVVALAAARHRGAVEAVLANTRGELCEGTGSNVFVVVDGQILTPSLECGPLAGVTRALVLEWCADAGMPVRERRLPLDVLQTADEVFLTSSTRDVFPVDAVDDRRLVPGPVTAAVADLFRARSALDPDP